MRLMSCLKLPNYKKKLKKVLHLLPSSKKAAACKSFFITTSSSFTSTLRRYCNLNKIPKSIHKATKRRPSRYNYNRRSYHHLMARTPTASPATHVYVDKIFAQPQEKKVVSKEEADQMATSSNGNEGGDGSAARRRKYEWRKYVSSMPRVPGGVDEKAEEFITKFRDQMRIQREQSIIDLQQMLERGT